MRKIVLSACLAIAPLSAHADLSLSSKPTRNMNCSGGVCTATAANAVLNVSDLATMLGSGDMTVATGSTAKDIDLQQPLSWTSTAKLTLDAQRSLTIRKPITVVGTGALTITYNDGGSGGDMYLFDEGQVTFWDMASSLVINGRNYILEADLPALASHLSMNQTGTFALAADYDAQNDKYKGSPITGFKGRFEGLGHTVRNLRLRGNGKSGLGMFDRTGSSVIRDIYLSNADVYSVRGSYIGILVGWNGGQITNASSGGKAGGASESADVGGLVGRNDGAIERSRSDAAVKSDIALAGGLVSINDGPIDQSYATGSVSGVIAGGFVGDSNGIVSNSYAMGPVVGGDSNGGGAGGFAGGMSPNMSGWQGLYSIGSVIGDCVGGFAAYDTGSELANAYWDLDTSGVTDPHRGACNVEDAPGIIGVADAKLRLELPDGFDPNVWGQSATINNGYPYLLANPPQ